MKCTDEAASGDAVTNEVLKDMFKLLKMGWCVMVSHMMAVEVVVVAVVVAAAAVAVVTVAVVVALAVRQQ